MVICGRQRQFPLALTLNGFPNDHTFFVGRFAGSSVGVLCAGQGGKPSHEKGVVLTFWSLLVPSLDRYGFCIMRNDKAVELAQEWARSMAKLHKAQTLMETAATLRRLAGEAFADGKDEAAHSLREASMSFQSDAELNDDPLYLEKREHAIKYLQTLEEPVVSEKES